MPTDRDPTEARALNALWRNHPATPVAERWSARAHRKARANRDMLLAWAAEQPDYRLRDCRNIGDATLAWIRANEPNAAALAAPAPDAGLREAAEALFDRGVFDYTFTPEQRVLIDALSAALSRQAEKETA